MIIDNFTDFVSFLKDMNGIIPVNWINHRRGMDNFEDCDKKFTFSVNFQKSFPLNSYTVVDNQIPYKTVVGEVDFFIARQFTSTDAMLSEIVECSLENVANKNLYCFIGRQVQYTILDDFNLNNIPKITVKQGNCYLPIKKEESFPLFTENVVRMAIENGNGEQFSSPQEVIEKLEILNQLKINGETS